MAHVGVDDGRTKIRQVSGKKVGWSMVVVPPCGATAGTDEKDIFDFCRSLMLGGVTTF